MFVEIISKVFIRIEFRYFQEQRIEREIKALREKHVEEEKSKRRGQVKRIEIETKTMIDNCFRRKF